MRGFLTVLTVAAAAEASRTAEHVVVVVRRWRIQLHNVFAAPKARH